MHTASSTPSRSVESASRAYASSRDPITTVSADSLPPHAASRLGASGVVPTTWKRATEPDAEAGPPGEILIDPRRRVNRPDVSVD